MFNSKRAIELVMVLVFIIVSLNPNNASAGNPFNAIQEKLDTIIQILEEKLQPVPCGYTCGGTLSDGGRWCNNLNGTIKDMTTGFIWLEDASCMSATWYDALKNVPENLRDGVCGLTDGSSWGDWRLATANELVGITQGVEAVSCFSPGFFIGIESGLYWCSTTHSIGNAYGVSMVLPGFQQGYPKDTQILPILPVRNAN